MDGTRTDRVELDSGEPHLEVICRPLARLLRVVLNVTLFEVLICGGIHIGVGSQFFVILTAEQIIHGLSHGFADNIPAGYLEGTDYAHLGDVRMLVVTGRIDPAPHRFYFEGVSADNEPFSGGLDQPGYPMGAEGDVEGFSYTLDAVVGDELYKYPVSPS